MKCKKNSPIWHFWTILGLNSAKLINFKTSESKFDHSSSNSIFSVKFRTWENLVRNSSELNFYKPLFFTRLLNSTRVSTPSCSSCMSSWLPSQFWCFFWSTALLQVSLDQKDYQVKLELSMIKFERQMQNDLIDPNCFIYLTRYTTNSRNRILQNVEFSPLVQTIQTIQFFLILQKARRARGRRVRPLASQWRLVPPMTTLTTNGSLNPLYAHQDLARPGRQSKPVERISLLFKFPP